MGEIFRRFTVKPIYLIQTINHVFNTRECAILTLVMVGLVTALFFIKSRELVVEALRLAYRLLKMRLYMAMLVYIAAWVYFFYRLEIWEVGSLKDTVKWYLFAATVMFFHVKRFKEDRGEYLKVVKEIFTGSILLEFFTDKFTLSYWTELAVLPMITFIAIMQVFSKTDKKYASVDKVLGRLLMIVGLLFLAFIIRHAVEDFRVWFNLDSLREFLLPVCLSILLLPFIFFLSVYMTYEEQYILMDNKLRSTKLQHFAKCMAFLSFYWKFSELERWQRRLKFEQVKTHTEFKASITDFKETLKTEQNPPVVLQAEGWSPYDAIHFLEPGFKMGFYDPRFEDKWMADSKSLYIGDSSHSNYLRYEVLGLRTVAHSLELHLNIMTPEEAGQAHSLLASYIVDLYFKATGEALPNKPLQAAESGRPFRFNNDGTCVRLKHNIWGNILHSYDLIFTVRRGNTTGYD